MEFEELNEETECALRMKSITVYKQQIQHYNVSQDFFIKNLTTELDTKE